MCVTLLNAFYALSCFIHLSLGYKFSWLLNNTGLRSTDLPCSWKSVYSFWLPPNLTTVIPWYLQFTGTRISFGYQNLQMLMSLMSNGMEHCVRSALCIRGLPALHQKYCAAGWIHRCETLRYGRLTIFIGRNPHVSGPFQFKPLLFKGQQYCYFIEQIKTLVQGQLNKRKLWIWTHTTKPIYLGTALCNIWPLSTRLF